MPEKTDEEIALEVQKGQKNSLGILIERYEPKLSRYAKKFLSDPEDGKDVVQDVFIKAYTNIQQFNVEKKFSSWIYRIAHNELVNALKKKSREPIISFDFDTILPHFITAKERAESKILDEDLKKNLDTYLSKLPAKYREILILYYLEQMDYKEVSEILKIPQSTVGVRLKRAKIALKKLLPHNLL
jgi:RNA polymerase sigma-70 factor (ECF subfamily)